MLKYIFVAATLALSTTTPALSHTANNEQSDTCLIESQPLHIWAINPKESTKLNVMMNNISRSNGPHKRIDFSLTAQNRSYLRDLVKQSPNCNVNFIPQWTFNGWGRLDLSQ